MAMIYVRSKPGRKAFHQGKVIPQDKFVPVPDTPYVRRLITHWEDLEVEGEFDPKVPPASKSKAPGKDQPRPIVGAKTKVEPSSQWAPGTGAPGSKV